MGQIFTNKSVSSGVKLSVWDAINDGVSLQPNSWMTTLLQVALTSGRHSSHAAHRFWCSRLSATKCLSPSPSNTITNTTVVGVLAAVSTIRPSLTTTITTTRPSRHPSPLFWERQQREAALPATSWGAQVIPLASTKSSIRLPRRTIFSEIYPSRGVLVWRLGVCILLRNVHNEAERKRMASWQFFQPFVVEEIILASKYDAKPRPKLTVCIWAPVEYLFFCVGSSHLNSALRIKKTCFWNIHAVYLI